MNTLHNGLHWVPEGSPTWNLIWSAIRRQFGSVTCEDTGLGFRCRDEDGHDGEDCTCPRGDFATSEVWQYVGTQIKSKTARTIVYVHQFRHRALRQGHDTYRVTWEIETFATRETGVLGWEHPMFDRRLNADGWRFGVVSPLREVGRQLNVMVNA